MPVLSTTIVATAAAYLADGITQGALRETGKTILAKLTSVFKTEKEKQLLLQLHEEPQNEELRGRIAGRLEAKLDEDEALQAEFAKLVTSMGDNGIQRINQIINSAGAVIVTDAKADGDINISTNSPKKD